MVAMNKQMIAVMQRRTELLARIAGQRGRAAEIGTRWQVPLALADQGLAAVHYARSRPVLIGVVTALMVMRSRGVLGMVGGAWGLWKTYCSVISVAKKLSSRCE